MNRFCRRLACNIGWHRIVTIGRVSNETEHVGCRDCRTQWAWWMRGKASMPWELVRYVHTGRGYDDKAAAQAKFERVGTWTE